MVVNTGLTIYNKSTNTTLSNLEIKASSLKRSVSTTAFGLRILRQSSKGRLSKSAKKMRIDKLRSWPTSSSRIVKCIRKRKLSKDISILLYIQFTHGFPSILYAEYTVVWSILVRILYYSAARLCSDFLWFSAITIQRSNKLT